MSTNSFLTGAIDFFSTRTFKYHQEKRFKKKKKYFENMNSQHKLAGLGRYGFYSEFFETRMKILVFGCNGLLIVR